MAAVLTALHVTAARAQPAGAVPGRLEFDAGIVWAGAQTLGSHDANLTTGTGSTLRLFSSTSDLLAAVGFEGQVAVKVTRTIDARASMSYARPQLTTRVSNDLENSASATLSETVQQYLVGGGLDWYVGSHRSGARVWPFIGGGAAYLRQLALYREVLGKLYLDRLIRAALVWTETPEFMEISAPALDAALASFGAGAGELDPARSRS